MVNYISKHSPNTENHIITEGFLSWTVNYHKTLPDFKKRPITTFLIEGFSKFFNVRIGLAFVWINFTFIFFCGFLIYYLGRLYTLSHSQSLLSVLFFYSSFSILLAYFIPIATYDEPVQYFFILSSLIALRRKVLPLFIILFTFAIITRENSMILLPGIILFLFWKNLKELFNNKLKSILAIAPMILPVLFYSVFIIWFYKTNPSIIEETKDAISSKSEVYLKNFGGLQNIIRTIFFFSSVFLLPVFFFIIYKKQHNLSKTESKLIAASLLTFCINTPLVLAFGYAEECRVFTLPLLFLFPIFGKIITNTLTFSSEFLTYIIHPKRLVILIASVVIGWIFFNYMFNLTNLTNGHLYAEYNTVSFFIISLTMMYKVFLKEKRVILK